MDKRIGVFAITALFSVGAFAGGDYKKFSEIDQDQDELITQQEAQGTKLEGKFDKIDQDGDGSISKDEYEQYKQQKKGGQGGDMGGQGGMQGGGGMQQGGGGM